MSEELFGPFKNIEITANLLRGRRACPWWSKVFNWRCPNGLTIRTRQELADAVALGGFGPVANWLGIKLDLRGVCIDGYELRGADLRCADLSCAKMRYVDLRSANLYGCCLREANLGGSDLRCADLRCADLRCANLSGAYLRGADLSDANLLDAIGLRHD